MVKIAPGTRIRITDRSWKHSYTTGTYIHYEGSTHYHRIRMDGVSESEYTMYSGLPLYEGEFEVL